MCAAAAKFYNGSSVSRHDAARRLRSHHRLKCKRRQPIRLDKLSFNDRRAYDGNRFVGKDRRALGHCEEIAREAKFGQIIKKLRRRVFKLLQRTEIINLFSLKRQRTQILNRLSETRCDQKIALGRKTTDRKLKSGNFIGFTSGEIARGHRKFVKISI